ncbi:MAG: hypothetical protein U5S82_23150 [Gammaproteobacteria bacterium]|nr:hypothetical protein [Gammaproteobacteria bacterium]
MPRTCCTRRRNFVSGEHYEPGTGVGFFIQEISRPYIERGLDRHAAAVQALADHSNVRAAVARAVAAGRA